LLRFLLLVFALSASPSLAATVTQVDHSQCDYLLEGQIQKGDAEQLAKIPPSYNGVTLCFNSPGGSLLEGRRLFDEIWRSNIRTHVLTGNRCESACALAFLGGSVMTGSAQIRMQSRSIEPGALLGFHAPSLNLQGSQSYPATQVNRAFEAALKSAEQIFAINIHEQHGISAMNNFLYQRIITTRPSSMYYISTVGDAVMANIGLSGADLPVTPKLENLTALCDNYWASARQDARPDYRSAAEYYDEIRRGSLGTRNPREVEVRGAFAALVNDYYSAAKFMEYGCRARIDDGFRSNSGAFIYVDFFRFWSGKVTEEDIAEAETKTVPAWYMLDPSTELAALATGRSATAGESADDFVEMVGLDLFGGDLDGGTLRLDTGKACVEACVGRGDCDAVTFDRWNKYCYLKSVEQTRKTLYVLSKATSWVKAPLDRDVFKARRGIIQHRDRKNKAFPGTPFSTLTGKKSLKDCMRSCWGYECLGVNFVPASGVCELFEAPDAYEDASGSVVGFRQQDILD